MTFGQKLRRVRKAKSLSAYRLAQISGIAANHIGAIEAGRIKSPGIEVASKLATALGVPVEQLLPGRAA